VYAVGGNRNAAELSGVKSKRTYFLTMMNMSDPRRLVRRA
jgi:putative multiple sugar transport system permease protein